VYLINRYYDPSLRQFISVDPAYSQTHQLYGYANENPVNGSDPSGMLSGALFYACDISSPLAYVVGICGNPPPPPKWVKRQTSELGTLTVYGPFYRLVRQDGYAQDCFKAELAVLWFGLYSGNNYKNGAGSALLNSLSNSMYSTPLNGQPSSCASSGFLQFVCEVSTILSNTVGEGTGKPTLVSAEVFHQSNEQSLAWFAYMANGSLLGVAQAALKAYQEVLDKATKFASGVY
jgi:hypothetical protein